MQRGFNLVEAIVAYALIALAVVVVARVFATGYRAGRVMEHRDQVMFLAQRLVEEKRALGYDGLTYPSLTADVGVYALESGTYALDGLVAGQRSTVATRLTIAYTIYDQLSLNPTYGTNTKRLWVELYWTDPNGTKTAVLETSVGKLL